MQPGDNPPVGILLCTRKGKIALIGPLADTRNNIAGTWSVAQAPEKYTTIKEAMEKALNGKATLLYAQGSNIWRDRELQKNGELGKSIAWGDEVKMKNEALQIAKEADVIVCAMGETADMSGIKVRQGETLLVPACENILYIMNCQTWKADSPNTTSMR